MWIPEIFNKFSLFTEANPTTPVTICQAMDYGYDLRMNLSSVNVIINLYSVFIL